MTDIEFMNLALDLALNGKGWTSPNPVVGAVVVKNGKVVGKGWHHGPGLAHAEVEAINDAGSLAMGSDLYVTLEPCNHTGRTPPCTQKILEAGIRRVIIGTEDPNPFVAGGGMDFLREKGLEVISGICRERAETVIEDFIWYVQNDKKPFVILKCASTLDGRIATRTGHSQWITNEHSRAYVHKLRHQIDGILVGSGTVKKDNPSLTARISGFKSSDPTRVILDTHLNLDPASNVMTPNSNAKTIIAVGQGVDPEKKALYETLGATVLEIPEDRGLIHLGLLMDRLGRLDIMSLMIEGGGRVIHSALQSNIVNKVLFFLATKILGGDDGIPVCRGMGPELMSDAMRLDRVTIKRFEEDILVQGYLK